MLGFKKILCVLLSLVLMVFALAACGEDDIANNGETGDYGGEVLTQDGAEFTTAHTATAYAEIDIKDYGKIKLELDGNKAPETVKNFINLAESKFYDGLTFHRIMEGFMMQGGDPEGTGTGGSGKTIKGEFKANGFTENDLTHTRGAISMARNSISMDSADSQFFIVHKDSAFLDGQYAAFGYVTEGIDVVDKVCETAKPVDDNGTIPKANQPIINSVTISYPEK